MKLKDRRRLEAKEADQAEGRRMRKPLTVNRIMVRKRGSNLFKSDNSFFRVLVKEMDLAHIKN